MTTINIINARVLAYVIDTPPVVIAESVNLVNKAIRDLQRKHNFKAMRALTALLTTTNLTRTLSAGQPSDFKEFRDRPYLVHNDGSTQIIWRASAREEALRIYDVSGTSDTGEPRVLVEADASDDDGTTAWEIYPLPDAASDYGDGDYRIQVPYYKYLPAITGDNTNWFTINAEWYVSFQAISEAFFLLQDEDRAALYAAKAGILREEAIAQSKQEWLSTMNTLRAYSGALTPAIGDL